MQEMDSHDIAQVDSRPQESYKRLLSKTYPELIVPTFHCYHLEPSCHLLSPGKLQTARHCLLALLSLHQISTFQSEWSLRYKSTQFRTLHLLSVSIKMKGKALTYYSLQDLCDLPSSSPDLTSYHLPPHSFCFNHWPCSFDTPRTAPSSQPRMPSSICLKYSSPR